MVKIDLIDYGTNQIYIFVNLAKTCPRTTNEYARSSTKARENNQNIKYLLFNMTKIYLFIAQFQQYIFGFPELPVEPSTQFVGARWSKDCNRHQSYCLNDYRADWMANLSVFKHFVDLKF